MFLVAVLFALVTPTSAGSVQMLEGIGFIVSNPDIMRKILAVAACSALGQCFIFFVVANFGSLQCSTVTTMRKIFSVLLSIFTKGYMLAPLGWFGFFMAGLGIIPELIPEHHATDLSFLWSIFAKGLQTPLRRFVVFVGSLGVNHS
jgi:UDP-galactose transporter B1